MVLVAVATLAGLLGVGVATTAHQVAVATANLKKRTRR